MRILTLTSSDGVKNAVATVFVDKDKKHFNIKHGSRGKGLHVISFGLDKIYFDATKSDSGTFELKDDNYILIPIKKDGAQIKDSQGNLLYSISVDNVKYHRKDIILFLEIPNNNYLDVEFTATGDVSIIGEGIIGKSRNETLYSSPAPVLEIFGNCVVKWTGKNENGDEVSGGFNYDRSNGFVIH